jgi:hypothetical protein
MVRWSSLGMRLQEMVQNVQQHQHLLLVTLDELGLANVIDDYIPNFFRFRAPETTDIERVQSQRFGEDARAQRSRASSVNPQNLLA